MTGVSFSVLTNQVAIICKIILVLYMLAYVFSRDFLQRVFLF